MHGCGRFQMQCEVQVEQQPAPCRGLCRRLYNDSGRFQMGNMQDWQHSAMYSAFMVSGAVDLIGFYCPGVLPAGTEHVRAQACNLALLAVAFVML